ADGGVGTGRHLRRILVGDVAHAGGHGPVVTRVLHRHVVQVVVVRLHQVGRTVVGVEVLVVVRVALGGTDPLHAVAEAPAVEGVVQAHLAGVARGADHAVGIAVLDGRQALATLLQEVRDLDVGDELAGADVTTVAQVVVPAT